MSGVCPEIEKEKIHMYLRIPTVAGHELLCCGGSPSLPQSFLFNGILPYTPTPHGSHSQQSYLSLSSAGITRSPRFPQVLVLLLHVP